MKQKYFLTLILIASSLITTSCSNPDSQRDRERDQLQAAVNEKESTLTPLAGRYEGTLTSLDGRIQNVVLIIIPTIMIVQNPGRNDVTEMPTLGGSLNIYLREGDVADVIPVAQFGNTMFDGSTGHIRMTGNMNTPGTLGNILSTMDGTISGPPENLVLRGKLTNSIRGELGTVEVQRKQLQNP